MSTEGSSPDAWMHDAWRSLIKELALFGQSFIGFAKSPREFARKWMNGETRPMNPFGYFGLCLVFGAPVQFLLWLRVQPLLDELANKQNVHVSGNLLDLWKAIGPYVTALLFGLLMHPFLRLFGSKRSIAVTLSILFYVHGVQTFLSWVLLPYHYLYAYAAISVEHVNAGWELSSLALLPIIVGYQVAGLSGAHGLKISRTLLAVLLSFVAFVVVALATTAVLVKLHHAH